MIRFLSSIRGSKNGQLLFAAVGTSLVTYALYKYLKKMTAKKTYKEHTINLVAFGLVARQ